MGNYLSQNDDEISVIKKIYNLNLADFKRISEHLTKQNFNNIETGFIRSIYNKHSTLKNKVPDTKFIPVHTLLLTLADLSNKEQIKQTETKKPNTTEFKLEEILQIFGINKNYTEKELKLSYKKLALKYHPDRGGDINKFKLITQFYEKLSENLLLKKNDKQFTELKNGSQDYIKKQSSDNNKNLQMNMENFNQTKFNQIFNENSVDIDDSEHFGYGDWINSNKYDKTDIKKTPMTGSFNLSTFNRGYNENNKQTQDIVEYKIPDAFELADSLSYRELGQGSNINYTTKKYSDFKEAHTTTRLAPDNSQRKQFKNIDELNSTRSNIETYTDKELNVIKQYENNQKLKEEQTQQNISRHDEIYFRNFNTIHKKMLDSNILH
jgi:curved DNA-binding protein CbpA